VNYTAGPGRTYTDSSGKTVTVPTTNRTVSLDPAQQAILNQQNQANLGLGKLANSEIGKLGGALNKPFVTAQTLPAAGKPVAAPSLDTRRINADPMQRQIADAGQITGNIADAGSIQRGFGDAGEIQRNYGPTDYSADRKKVEDAFLSRSNDQFARDESALDTKLRNQGLTPGSEAYNTQFDQLRRARNDETNQAILYGGQEQSRLAGLSRDAAQFGNDAQQQAYAQALGRGQFSNEAQGQQFGQNQTRSQFSNDAQAQRFGQNQAKGLFANQATQSTFDNGLSSQGAINTARSAQYGLSSSAADAQTANRKRALEEAFALRQQPINEALGLASGTQLNVPQFSAPYQQGVNAAPIADLIGQDYQSRLANSNAKASGLFGLLGNLGAAGITASDRRLKTEIRRLGTLFGSIGLYRYKLVGKDTIGVMADEVAKVLPHAVRKIGGIFMVDYPEVMAHVG
jgi:hypothetical protein